MSLARCIPELLAQGKLTADQAAQAEAVYGARVRHHNRSMGAAAADALASSEAAEAMAIAAARRKRLAMLGRDAQKRMLVDLARYDGGGGDPLDPRAIVALFDRDARAPYANVEARRKAIKARAHGEIDGLLAEHRRTLTGQLRNRAQMDEIGRELFGEATGSPHARELAEGWQRAAELLRRRFNAAGGAIGKIDRWGLPQSHDARSVRRAGYAAWREEIWPRLDRERMIDEDSGLPFDDEALEAALRDVFETIRTDGLAKVTPGGGGGRSLANRRAEHRFLHFRSYDDWAAYQARFGAGTAFDAMMGHIEAMSRDIAAMEIFGPNPAASVRWLKDGAAKNAALHGDDAGRASDRAFASGREVDRLWAQYTGQLNRPESRAIALGFGAVRSLQTAAKLGSATLSAVSDLGFQAATRRYNGLPVAGVIGDYAQLLNPANAADRRFAVRRGLIAEEWATMTAAQNRYLVEELTGEVSARLADGVLRASGLSAFTQAGRWAFGMEFLDTLQGRFDRRFDALEPELRRSLERHGFAAADWDAIRATPLDHAHRGQKFFRPQDVADPALGDRLLEMVLTETDYAVPVADLRTRAMINSVAPRGTIAGEMVRSAFLFKSFGISVVLSHGRRALEQPGWRGKLGYAGGLTIALTLGGAVALQLKAIATGKDPRPMGDPAFWGAATLQGGGFGIFGDFFSSQTNRFGGGFGQTAAGPMAQTIDQLGRVFTGKDNAWEAWRLVEQETPGQSLWYAKLVFDRVVNDQIQSLIDPDYRQAWRRMERRAGETGQGFFWGPGETVPERAPDFSNILEGAPQ